MLRLDLRRQYFSGKKYGDGNYIVVITINGNYFNWYQQ